MRWCSHRIVHWESFLEFSSLSIYLSITLYHLFSLLLPFNHLSWGAQLGLRIPLVARQFNYLVNHFLSWCGGVHTVLCIGRFFWNFPPETVIRFTFRVVLTCGVSVKCYYGWFIIESDILFLSLKVIYCSSGCIVVKYTTFYFVKHLHLVACQS